MDYTYSVNTGYEDSSNISQRVNGSAGEAASLGFDFALGNSLQKEWELDLVASIDRTRFSGDELADETRKSVQGSALYKSLESNFSFTSLLDISQAPVNRFQTQEINNIRDQTVYALIPSYFFAINPSDTINTSFTYVDFNLEGIQNVQNVQIGQAQSSKDTNFLINYAKQLNETNVLAVNFRTGKTDFDNDDGLFILDYDRDDLFLSWTVVGETDQIQVELGRSEILDQLDRKTNLNTKLLSYTRRLNSADILTLNYSDGFNNPLSNIQATGALAVNRQNNNVTAAQQSKQFDINLTHTGDSFNFNIGAADVKLTQSFTNNTEDRRSYSFALTYLISRALDISGRSNVVLNYNKSDSDFDSQLTNVTSNEIENYSLSYNYVHSRNLIVSLSYSVRDTLQTLNDSNQINTKSKSTLLTVSYSDRGKF